MSTSFQVREKIVELPVVSTLENGTGQLYRRREVFDAQGRLIWSMDPRGYITSYEYDLATGAHVRRVDDVDVSTAMNVPEGWVTPAGGGLNLETVYQNDALGQTPSHPVPAPRP